MTQAAFRRFSEDRFIARQLEALKELGLDDEALAREEAMLREGFAQAGWLAALANLEGA